MPEVLLGMPSLRGVGVTMFSCTFPHIYQLVRDLPRLTRLVSLSCLEEGAHWSLVQKAEQLHREAERVARLFDTGVSMKVDLVGMGREQIMAAYSGRPVVWYEYGKIK